MKSRWDEVLKDVEKEFYACESTIKAIGKIEPLTPLEKSFLSVYETIIKLAKLSLNIICGQGKTIDEFTERVKALSNDVENLKRRLEQWESLR